ncbi:MAG: ABC-2 family transporter protein [Patescibacteria group bacterium]
MSYKPYLSFFNKAFSSRVQYRAEIVLWVLLNILPTVVMFAVWHSILDSGPINNFDQQRITHYYLLSLIINGTISAYFIDQYALQIREGKIDHYLVKPISFFTQIFSRNLGGKAFYLSVAMPLFLVFYYFSTIALPFELRSSQFFSFLLLVGLGFIFEFLVSYLILLSAFWLEEAMQYSTLNGCLSRFLVAQ